MNTDSNVTELDECENELDSAANEITESKLSFSQFIKSCSSTDDSLTSKMNTNSILTKIDECENELDSAANEITESKLSFSQFGKSCSSTDDSLTCKTNTDSILTTLDDGENQSDSVTNEIAESKLSFSQFGKSCISTTDDSSTSKMNTDSILTKLDEGKNQLDSVTNELAESKISFSQFGKSRSSKVKFTNIEMRYYPIILGDNPGGFLGGPPLSMSFEYSHRVVMAIEQYESKRKSERKFGNQLLTTPLFRKNLLIREAGYSEATINEAEKEIEKIKKKRKSTIRRLTVLEKFGKMFSIPDNFR